LKITNISHGISPEVLNLRKAGKANSLSGGIMFRWFAGRKRRKNAAGQVAWKKLSRIPQS
jgi:hypothetical protein